MPKQSILLFFFFLIYIERFFDQKIIIIIICFTIIFTHLGKIIIIMMMQKYIIFSLEHLEWNSVQFFCHYHLTLFLVRDYFSSLYSFFCGFFFHSKYTMIMMMMMVMVFFVWGFFLVTIFSGSNFYTHTLNMHHIHT